MGIRVLNTADWHFNATTNGVWSAELGMNTTWAEAVNSVKQIVQICNDENVDFLVIAGDLFNDGRPSAESVALLVGLLNKLDKTKVIAADGNHDQYGVIGNHRTPIGAYLADQPWCHGYASNSCVIDADGFDFAMVPWHRVAGTASLDVTSSVLRDSVKRLADEVRQPSILYGHLVLDEMSFTKNGVINVDRGSETLMSTSVLEATIPLADLENGPWTLARSGHIHKPQSIYLGSIYRVDYGEAGETKRVELVDVEEDGTYTSRSIPLKTRNLHDVDLTETGKLLDVTADMMEKGDLATFRFAYDMEIPSRTRAKIEELRKRGIYASIASTPRPRKDGRVAHLGVGIKTNRREAMDIYVKDKWGDDPETAAGVMRTFDDACEDYQRVTTE